MSYLNFLEKLKGKIQIKRLKKKIARHKVSNEKMKICCNSSFERLISDDFAKDQEASEASPSVTPLPSQYICETAIVIMGKKSLDIHQIRKRTCSRNTNNK